MGQLEVDASSTQFPLTVSVDVLGNGGVPGLNVTVAVRQPTVAGSYLDWASLTFKTSGWTQKNLPMTDEGNGIYQALLNVAGLGFTSLQLPVTLTAEYTSTGTGSAGIAFDTLTISRLRRDASLSRKFHTNRLAETPGGPGLLTLYDDDGATVIQSQTLLDFAGQPVAAAPGTPGQRGQGSL